MLVEAARKVGVVGAELMDERGQKTILRGTIDGSPVALKVVRLDAGRNEATEVTVERARREFDALDGTRNDHVVAVAGPFVEIGDPLAAVAWAEEFVEGEDLGELLGVPWDWVDALAMATDVALGLTAFHERNVVHRDLSPSNIRRRVGTGSYVVLDPGYARFADYTTITELGQPGTTGHLSPEHLDGGDGPVRRSDIYCVGILFFTALAGQPPIPLDDLDTYRSQLLGGDPRSIAEARGDLTDDRARLVDTCMRRQPARRFRDASHFLRQAGLT